MDTTGEGTDVTTGIDGEYSCLVKRMITVCGVCCIHSSVIVLCTISYLLVSSLVKK